MTTRTAMTGDMRLAATRKERWAWYLYDFGNSAYAAVVLLAVYSAYFQGTVVGGAEGSRLWGLAVGIAMLVVAVTSPVLGAVADYSGSKKQFLLFYTVMAVLFTAALFFAKPGSVAIGMGFFILAEIGYRSAQVFYNGLLPEIAAPEEIGRVSGNGWAIGTAGGVICLLLVLPLIVLQQNGVIPLEGTLVVRLTLLITAVFFALSAIPIFLWLPERAKGKVLPQGETYLSVALKQLRRTFSKARSFKEFIKYMVAFLVYNDGVIMALDFAAIIGAVLFGMNQQDLIIFVIVVQITNVFGAFAFGRWVDIIGGKHSLALSIVIMVGAVAAMFFAQNSTQFFMIGAVAGFAMAGTQSVSRTMVGMFAPAGQSAEFYGFFAMTGRTSSFIGPAVYGALAFRAAQWYERQGETAVLAEQLGQRIAILSIAAFLLVGLLLLVFVNEGKARQTATTSAAAAPDRQG
ncbi:MAG: MFS transporter [Ardenticatenaceae bacterium]|nr:MFS transporter [Anaerolineales bacterium]MCB8922450.1 MFS transporter [Ardenticatenaceae bacterium]MCB8989918.1 MFS transporter [Ardenticatenaceae bacterium]